MPILNYRVYDTVLEIFQSLSPEKKKNVCESIVEEFAEPDTTNQLLSAVEKLAKQTASVDKAFETVRSGLKMLDERDVKDEDGTPIPKFHLRWVGFQDVSLCVILDRVISL